MTKSGYQRRPHVRGLGAGLAALCLGLCSQATSQAQVFEFNGSGDWTVHDRPEVTTRDGVTQIDPPAVRRPRGGARLTLNRADLAAAADNADISPDLVEAVAWRESHLRPGVISSAGAIGEMQLMPGTARDLGVDPFVTRQNLGGGAAYLAMLLRRYNGDLIRALAAYNAGPGAVDRFGGVPPYKETQDYVAAVLDRLSQTAARAPER